MNFRAKLLSTAMLAIVAASSNAQEGVRYYGEAGYTFGEVEISDLDSADVGLFAVTLGADVHKYLAIEVMIAGGVADDQVDVTIPELDEYLDEYDVEAELNVEVDNTYGLFLKPKFNLTEELEVFAKLGWVQSELALDVDATVVDYWGDSYSASESESESDDDFAYAVGAQYSFLPNAYVSASYTSLYDEDDIELSGWNLSLGMKF